jgi:uncharacterized protein YraI
MGRTKLLTAASLLIIMVISACGTGPTTAGVSSQAPAIPPGTQTSEALAATSEVQTAVAKAVAATLASMATSTPESSPPASPTPTPALTSTPSTAMVSVSVATNCRSGPGTEYDVLGVLKVGESAQVVGRSQAGNRWVIKLPSNPSITCWLLSQYATVSGNATGLPVISAPSTPVPTYKPSQQVSFQVVYTSISRCDKKYALKFTITNTGGLTWVATSVYAKDLATGEEHSTSYDSFPDIQDDCSIASNDQDLQPGEVGITTSGEFSNNPSGHTFTASIRVCTQKGMAGTCVDDSIRFMP